MFELLYCSALNKISKNVGTFPKAFALQRCLFGLPGEYRASNIKYE